ncbi:type IV pilin protein [Streptomyces sp. NPDC056257]|uniref:type IV pilin protein n=1 Tax=Streptomyces sp. NPDC056257 TaxID=3345765 RepID=UPI0035D6419F
MYTHLQGNVRQRMRARNKRAEAGFTLIELLVVIVILGILSAIVVFSVSGINDKGQVSACKTDKSTIQTAEEAYFVTKNVYGTVDELKTGGFLTEVSSWYKATPSDDKKTYSVEALPGKPCAGV